VLGGPQRFRAIGAARVARWLREPLWLAVGLTLLVGVAGMSVVSAIKRDLLAAAGRSEPRAVAILAEPGAADAELWSRAARDLDLEFAAIASVAALDWKTHRAVVLTGSVELTEHEVAEVERFLDAGRGAVMAGLPAEGAPLRDLLFSLFPATGFAPQPEPVELRVSSRGPATAGIEGLSVGASSGSAVAAAADRESGLVWDLPPAEDSATTASGELPRGALLFGHYGRAPVLWLGAAADAFVPGADSARLLENALSYASGSPVAELARWPDGREAAAVALEPAAPRPTDPDAAAFGLDADPDALIGRWLTGFDRVARSGGVYALDPGQARADTRAAALAVVEHQLRLRRGWLAEPAQVQSWQRARAALQTELRLAPDARVEIRVANPGSESIDGATVRVYLPRGSQPPHSVETPLGGPAPRLRVARNHAWIELIADEIASGDEIVYAFSY